MNSINYDIRPIDTENVINTRNRIRLSAAFILFGALLSISVRSSLTQPNVSWIHMFHFLLQPLVFVITLLDVTNYVYIVSMATAVATVADGAVFILNSISINRCLNEATASCFNRLYESFIWLAIAAWILVFIIIEITQLNQLLNQLGEKDKIEKANKETIKYENKAPTWNTKIVYVRKIRVINVFLFTFDVAYAISIGTQIADMPILSFAFLHILLDPIIFFNIDEITQTTSITTYEIFRIFYVVSAISDSVVLLFLLQNTIVTIGNMLSLLICTLFLATDIVQTLYMTIVIDSTTHYMQFKKKITD